MLTCAAFSDLILAVHILAVVIGFGYTFAYPLMLSISARLEPRSLPSFHQLQVRLHQRLANPGLVVMLLAGIYLASHEHVWKAFYVQWGVAAVVVLGGLSGALVIPTEKKLAAQAERDVAGAGPGPVVLSAEYSALRGRARILAGLISLLITVTVFLMATHAGQ